MFKNKKDIFLLISVFTTGMAVLIIEIIAIRIISPYYGNTIYTASSVIGTVLAALSLGYYLGGRFSDKYPEHGFFYFIIFVSGILVILMHYLNIFILPILSLYLSIVSGPLISSLLIFFIPAFSLGMLSPFAVKLHKPNRELEVSGKDNVGQQSGEVFFWSTLGSIVGSILTGFFLIPYFGINLIVIATGIFITAWGFCGILIFFPIKKKVLSLIIFILIVFGFLIFYNSSKTTTNIVYEKDGLYEKITIMDGQWFGKPARFLMQDKSNSAAMYLNSDSLAYDYTKYYELYKLINPKAKSAFIIGGGGYSIPKALLNDSPEMQVEVTEIEPELYSLAQKYFNLKETSRLSNYTEDGRHFLSKSPKKYDLIVSDVYYSFFSIPNHFTTEEFFDLAKNKLANNGVFIGNFVGDLNPNSPSFIFSEIKTFKESFPNSYFFGVNSATNSTPQNIIFLGINGKAKIDFNNIPENVDPIIKNIAEKNIDLAEFDFSKYEKLTDDFAPVEYLVSRVMSRWY